MTMVDAGLQREPHARPGRFQFSLATALIVVTGVCVALSLVLCHLTFGLMAAIVLVGGGWSAAARRAGYRKLAYCLAASALGVIGHLVLAGLFLTFSGPEFLGEVWFGPLPVLWMSMSTAVAAMLIRRLRSEPVVAALVGVYLTAMVFPLFLAAATPFFGMIPLVEVPVSGPEDGLLLALLGLLGGALLATITLPATWPTGMLFCAILRRIDPLREVWVWAGRDEWKVVHRDAEPSHGESSGPLP